MTDENGSYVVQPGDTLSGIAQQKGVTWQNIAQANSIEDPRTLRVGQKLKIPASKAGKVHAHVLDADHNPLSNVSYSIKSADREVSGKTGTGGQTDDYLPLTQGEAIEFFIQKLNGEWKKVHETTSSSIDKLVTLISPRLKLSTQTTLHPQNTDTSEHGAKTGPKAAPSGTQTTSKFAPDKGVKTKQAMDSGGASVLKVTSDDASLDEFLDKYTGDPITEDDYKAAAKSLNCKVNAVKAVHETEVGAGSFTVVDDRTVPKILYERHYFYRLSGKKYWDTNPDLSYPVGYYRLKKKYYKKTEKLTKTDGTTADVDVWVRYSDKDKAHAAGAETGKQLLDEGVLDDDRDFYKDSYRRLRKAFRLDATAALESCSWGAFQIMGSNYKTLGYDSVQAMVRALSRSEKAHLEGFVSFVKADAVLLKAMQKEEFTTFASRYNGPSYAENDYDGKMKRNFDVLEKADAKSGAQEGK
ncbi:LysM peptidoglycan-binding domain-containing protein [Paraburkholderia acidipaludis]|uniref:LysM peptidoglycan-binding domain-containing protein n=1 Tax=Paraburkholderia acidipaludis TaxID=660537 RepID=UPI000A039F15|nr:N-acetylmuramidase domain-containing protein [Paraburkholderia acidipaludis]